MISLRQSPTTRPITVSAIRSAAPSARTRWRWACVVSSVVGVLALVASAAGLLLNGVYGEAGSTAEMLRGYDLVTLVFVVPALVLSQLQTRRASDRAS
jgi:cytochrome bd-type quinol oxidase subunit 2